MSVLLYTWKITGFPSTKKHSNTGGNVTTTLTSVHVSAARTFNDQRVTRDSTVTVKRTSHPGMTAALNKASSVAMEAYSPPGGKNQQPWEAYCECEQCWVTSRDESLEWKLPRSRSPNTITGHPSLLSVAVLNHTSPFNVDSFHGSAVLIHSSISHGVWSLCI